jgi:two-component system, NarL family, nitrate/nitrite response regulator NarL
MAKLLDGRLQGGNATSQREDQHPQQRLTERQHRVLGGIFEGLTNKEIAVALDISESAVKATVQHIFRKMRVRTRAQLVRIAIEDSLGGSGRELRARLNCDG